MSNKKQWASLLLAAAMTLGLTACGDSTSDSDAETTADDQTDDSVAVQVQTVSLNDISTQNKVSGKVAADDEATVSVSVSAKCVATYADAGDMVQKGQAICKLDLSSTLSSYSAANISYSSAVQSYKDQKEVFASQISLYQKNLDDLKALFEIGAASQIEIDQAQLQLDSAIAQRNSTLAQLEAGIESYKSSVEQLSTALENVDGAGNVIAPISGTLVTMSASKDNYVSPGAPIAVIDGADKMKITVSVSEALVPKLNIGDSADVSVSAANQTFVGTIRSVEQAANAQTKLYTVTLSVPSTATGLLSGMFADVTFRTDKADSTVVIPTEAILTSGSTQYVYVVENDNTAKYIEVQTGLTGDGVTEVTSGLTEGEQLVTVGQSYLSDGDAVRIVSGED